MQAVNTSNLLAVDGGRPPRFLPGTEPSTVCQLCRIGHGMCLLHSVREEVWKTANLPHFHRSHAGNLVLVLQDEFGRRAVHH